MRADTTWFGDFQIIGGQYHARSGPTKQSVAWTFDRGNGPTNDPNRITNGEGWASIDLTRNTITYFRIADASLNLGPGVTPPIIDGTKSIWVGADYSQTRAYCWSSNAGYGDNWKQCLVSGPLTYNGSGSVSLSFKYFNDSESCLDGTQVYLKRADGTELLLNPSSCFTGGFTDSIGTYRNPALYSRDITQQEIGAAQDIRIVFEFVSDNIGSSVDGTVCPVYGPFGADDVRLLGGGIDVLYDFENGLGPWTPAVGSPVGDFAGVADVGCYTILDPCACKLSGNILEAHDGLCDGGTHPTGQHVMLESPICDVAGNVSPKQIFMDLDMYVQLPLENGVFFRSGWTYFPWTCQETGAVGWSPRVGENSFQIYGEDGICQSVRFGGTNLGVAGTPVPPTAEKVIAILEIFSDCAAFTITNCTGVTNATPLFDNIAVGTTASVHAPIINFDNGTSFVDAGSYPSDLFDPRAPGQANIGLDIYQGAANKPDYSGDSLVVVGPQPGSDPNNRWEARLWWRVAKRAPLQSDRANGVDTRYKIWRDRVADGKQIDRPYKPEFAFGWMDSVQNGTIPLRNKFISSFRENDDEFVGEGNPENEMLWDDVFFPGTRIEYFITSNYVGTPNTLYYFPDTTGGYFRELEILPGLRDAHVPGCGGTGFDVCVFHPATLYIDVGQYQPQQFFIENGLRTILNGLPACQDPKGCEIPADRNWDRFDYDYGCT
jgi:hypothetical protein